MGIFKKIHLKDPFRKLHPVKNVKNVFKFVEKDTKSIVKFSGKQIDKLTSSVSKGITNLTSPSMLLIGGVALIFIISMK